MGTVGFSCQASVVKKPSSILSKIAAMILLETDYRRVATCTP